MPPVPDFTAEWYRRAGRELEPHSALHAAWSRAIASDDELLSLIDALARPHRQPSLVLCAAAFAGAPTTAPWPEVRGWLVEHWDAVEAVAAARRTQTNEPARTLPLAVALSRIEGPIALLEIGASAGLCLLPDRYLLRFHSAGRSTTLGTGSPALDCALTGPGPVPVRMPEILWRRGLDLAPLSVREPEDVRWLEALVPPDRPDRLLRLRQAVATARSDPPEVLRGNALEGLAAAFDGAPSTAVRVVVSLGTAVYLPRQARAELLPVIAAHGARAVTLEAAEALPQVADALRGYPAAEGPSFVLALDGRPLARCAPHGGRVSLLGPPASDA